MKLQKHLNRNRHIPRVVSEAVADNPHFESTEVPEPESPEPEYSSDSLHFHSPTIVNIGCPPRPSYVSQPERKYPRLSTISNIVPRPRRKAKVDEQKLPPLETISDILQLLRIGNYIIDLPNVYDQMESEPIGSCDFVGNLTPISQGIMPRRLFNDKPQQQQFKFVLPHDVEILGTDRTGLTPINIGDWLSELADPKFRKYRKLPFLVVTQKANMKFEALSGWYTIMITIYD